MTFSSIVGEAVRAWTLVRQGVIAELENVPAEQWNYRPHPDARSISDIARHIADAGMGFTVELLRPDGTFRRLLDKHESTLKNGTSKEVLLERLRATGRDTANWLTMLDETFAAHDIVTAVGHESRLTGLWFAISHEMYHRGQLATYARALGIVPAMTQRMTALRPAVKNAA